MKYSFNKKNILIIKIGQNIMTKSFNIEEILNETTFKQYQLFLDAGRSS